MAEPGSSRGRPIAAVERTVAVLEALAAAGGASLGTNEPPAAPASTRARSRACSGRSRTRGSSRATARAAAGASARASCASPTPRWPALTCAPWRGRTCSRWWPRRGRPPRSRCRPGRRRSPRTSWRARAASRAVPRSGARRSPTRRPSGGSCSRTSPRCWTRCRRRSSASPPAQSRTRRSCARIVEAVRDAGWAEVAGEREDGLNAVAAPVHGHGGALVAVLGVQGPERFDAAARRAAVAPLLRAAGELSAALGARPS